MDRFQSFLESRLNLDTILNDSTGSDKDVQYVRNQPDCDFSDDPLTNEVEQCEFPIRVLHVNAQGLQSAYSELKFLLNSSPKDIVAVCETFFSQKSSKCLCCPFRV